MRCINLKRMFGDRHRVACEESYDADHGPNSRVEDPRVMILLCQHGHISLWGGSKLAACTNNNGPIANRLRKLPFIDKSAGMDGDDGVDVVFDAKHFGTVAEIMKPRRRRQVSEAERKRLAAIGFQKGQHLHAQTLETASGDVSRSLACSDGRGDSMRFPVPRSGATVP